MDIAKRCNRPFDYECIQFAVRDKEFVRLYGVMEQRLLLETEGTADGF